MIYLAIPFLIAGAVVRYFAAKMEESSDTGFLRALGIGLMGLGLALGTLSTVTIVSAGHVGVKALFGKVQEDYLPEGLHFVNPFLSVIEMSVRTEAYTMTGEQTITVLSADGLRMPLDVTVNYRLIATDAPWAYRNLGYYYEEKLILPPTRTAVREAASLFTSQELYATKRNAAAGNMQSSLREKIDVILQEYNHTGSVVAVQQVLLRNVGLPDKVREAIEKKLEAEQQAQQMEFVLAKERQEAERKEIEAKGIAAFQDIVRQGIDEQLLRWKGIEATRELAESGNAKVLIFGNSDTGGLPVILQPSK